MSKKTQNRRWTPLQREVADLYLKGRTFTELVESGYTTHMVSKVTNAIKRGDTPSEKDQRGRKGQAAAFKAVTVQTSRTEAPASAPVRPVTVHSPSTIVRGRVVDAVPIGSLLIIPEDTYITQHGWFLLHDTYKLSQQQLSYGGSMGDFIVDLCQLFRELVSFPEIPFVFEEKIKEVVSDDGQSTDNGSSLPEGGGGEGDEGGLEDDDDDA